MEKQKTNYQRKKISEIMNKLKVKEFAIATLGCVLFALSVNLLITPMKLYNGGMFGIAQILRTIIVDKLGINIPLNIDISGIIYYSLNIPILVLAYRKFSRNFFLKTILMTSILTTLLTIIPIPQNRIIEDTLTGCLIGGAISGIGVGLFLYAGYSAGGQDVFSLYISKRKPGMTVGNMNIIINIFVFGVCLLMYDVQTVIYSLIYVMVSGVAIDKVHEQNINVWLMIFTKVEGMPEILLKTRGVTSWEGVGAYTNEKTYIHSMMVNKFEIRQITEAIKHIDPKAFVIRTEGPQVNGNFEKRL